MRRRSVYLIMTVIVTALLVGGCGAATQSGTSAHTETVGANGVRMETRQVSGFTALTFTGVGKIAIRQTGQEVLTITAPSNLLPLVTTSVAQGRLTIGFQGTPSAADQNTIAYGLQVKQLTDIQVQGAGNVSAAGLSLKGATLSTTIAGSGTVKLVGNAQGQEVHVSGTGIYNGASFATYTGSVNVTDGGRAVVNVTSALHAYASGSGSIEYIGSPSVIKTVTGNGSITPRG